MMCYAKPRPRCSAHALQKLNRLQEWKNRSPDSPNIDHKIFVAQEEYYKTKKGIKELKEKGDFVKAEFNQKLYDKQMEEYKQIQTFPNKQTDIKLSVEEQAAASKNKVVKLSGEYSKLINTTITGGVYETQFHKELTPTEVEANDKLLQIGEEINQLATLYGLPTEQEWEDVNKKIEPIAKKFELLKQEQENELKQLNQNYTEKMISFEDYKKQWDELSAKTKQGEQTLQEENDKIVEPFITKQREAYRAALKNIGVDFMDENQLDDFVYPKNRSANKVYFEVRKAATYYPKSFFEGIKKNNWVVEVAQTSKRATYSTYRKNGSNQPTHSILHSTTNELHTTTHELGHYMEATNPYIGNAERIFVKNEQQKGDDKFFWGEGVNKKEKYATKNLFVDYSARVYDERTDMLFPNQTQYGKSYEVLTTGMEVLFFGKYGGGNGVRLKLD